MRTIWKFPVLKSGYQELYMPESAEILTVDTIDNRPYVWALVDPEAPKVYRKFCTFMTGEEMPEKRYNCSYIGTYQLTIGQLYVIHLFELYNLKPAEDGIS